MSWSALDHGAKLKQMDDLSEEDRKRVIDSGCLLVPERSANELDWDDAIARYNRRISEDEANGR